MMLDVSSGGNGKGDIILKRGLGMRLRDKNDSRALCPLVCPLRPPVMFIHIGQTTPGHRVPEKNTLPDLL